MFFIQTDDRLSEWYCAPALPDEIPYQYKLGDVGNPGHASMDYFFNYCKFSDDQNRFGTPSQLFTAGMKVRGSCSPMNSIL